MARVYDTNYRAVREVDLVAETVTTLAGRVRGAQDGQGAAARFANIRGIANDGAGGVLVSDGYNHAVRHVGADGWVTTIAGELGVDRYREGDEPLFRGPAGLIQSASGDFLVIDSEAAVVRRLSRDGHTEWVAGRPLIEGREILAGDDGPAHEATFRWPGAIAEGEGGTLYVLERYRVRVID